MKFIIAPPKWQCNSCLDVSENAVCKGSCSQIYNSIEIVGNKVYYADNSGRICWIFLTQIKIIGE